MAKKVQKENNVETENENYNEHLMIDFVKFSSKFRVRSQYCQLDTDYNLYDL